MKELHTIKIKNMKKFTKEGKEVIIVKEIEGGFLTKGVYNYWDEENEEEAETINETIVFYAELFETAPTEKYADVVSKLKKVADDIRYQINDLKEVRDNEKSLIQKVSKFPIVQQLVDYITGNFLFVLYINTLEQIPKAQAYLSPYIAMAHTKCEGYWLYRLRNDNYFASDDIKLLTFKTQEELNTYSKKLLIERLESAKFNYNRSSNLKDILTKIHYTCKIKDDTDVLAAFDKKLKEFQKEDKIERETKLKKEVEELDNKRKELELLSQSI